MFSVFEISAILSKVNCSRASCSTFANRFEKISLKFVFKNFTKLKKFSYFCVIYTSSSIWTRNSSLLTDIVYSENILFNSSEITSISSGIIFSIKLHWSNSYNNDVNGMISSICVRCISYSVRAIVLLKIPNRESRNDY